jgi:transcription initiation factor TFIIIB Brf1 subunit/transcription initiation factor TFIIB
MAAMSCPICARRLARDEFRPAVGDVPNRWMCGDCDCVVNENDDEYESPEWTADTDATALARGTA